MFKFILKKILYGFLVMFGVVTVVFFIFHIKPGDPARMLGGNNANEEILQAINKDLGLDLPLYKQYLLYLNDISPFSIHETTNEESHLYLDSAKYSYTEMFSVSGSRVLVIKWPHFRRSYRTKQNVSEIISDSLPGTIYLALTSIILASVLGILMGIIAAINKGGFFDNFCTTIAILGISGPSYFVGLIFAWIGGSLWYEITYLPALPFIFMAGGLVVGIAFNRYSKKKILGRFSFNFLFESIFKAFGIGVLLWFVGLAVNGLMTYEFIPMINSYMELPGTGLEMAGSWLVPDEMGNEHFSWKNFILPTLALGIRPLAIVLQLTRSSLLDVLSQDYIRTATAKGLSKTKVIVKHALKNSLNPVITALSGWFASLLAGAVFIEQVFAWDGIGNKVYLAVFNNDLPVVIGTVLVISSMFVFINILVDITYGILDPRVRLKG